MTKKKKDKWEDMGTTTVPKGKAHVIRGFKEVEITEYIDGGRDGDYRPVKKKKTVIDKEEINWPK